MNIPIEKLLNKMSVEIESAKRESRIQGGDRRKIQEHIKILHSLCEVILDEDQPAPYVKEETQPRQQSIHQQPQPQVQPQSPVYTQPQAKPLKEEDANGDSLFDF